MNHPSPKRLSYHLLALAVISQGFLNADTISVTDLKGRAIDIELVSLVEDSVTFRKAGKDFTLPLASFDESSQSKIRENAAKLPALIPRIQPEVVIGKRRKKENNFYLVKQEITCTIKLTNPSLKLAVPPLTGRILMIGQDRETPDVYTVLSSQEVKAALKPGETSSQEMEPFITVYDSDNKGQGNIGGSQYVGYVLILLNEAGDVVLEHTVTGSFRKALADKPGLAKELVKQTDGVTLSDNLMPPRIGDRR